MLFDESDQFDVCYETFKSCPRSETSYCDIRERLTRKNVDREMSFHESSDEEIQNPINEVLKADQITEKMIEKFEKSVKMTEHDVINLTVFLVKRFQTCRLEGDSQIHLSQLMTCLNDIRVLLVIVSKKHTATEFLFIYQDPLWNYLKCYLKYFLGLIKLEPSATGILKQHESQLVHLFNMLARLFQVKQIEDGLRVEFMYYIVQLFFTSTSARINESIGNVICTAIYKYDWLYTYLENIFTFERNDEKVRSKYNFNIQNKKYNVNNTSMLLIRLIDYAIDLDINRNEDLQETLLTTFIQCGDIIRLCLRFNGDVLKSLIEDLNKISSDSAYETPRAGVTVLHYFILLNIRELIIRDRLNATANGYVIEAYFQTMTQLCTNFQQIEKKCTHLKISDGLIYDLLDNTDKSKDQFTLMSLMFTTTILSDRSFTEEDKTILHHSKLFFKHSEPVSQKKPKKGKTESQSNKKTAVATGTEPKYERILKSGQEKNYALCFNYFINERLNHTALAYCLESVLSKVKKTHSSNSTTATLKYLENVRKFYDKNFTLINDITNVRTTSIMYEIIQTSTHKSVLEAALSVLCEICSKRDTLYEKYKRTLCTMLCETDNASAMKTLCDFFLRKFQQENNLNSETNSTNASVEPQQEQFDAQFTVIHTLLTRLDMLDNPIFKSVILKFFSDIWFQNLEDLHKVERKVEQMMKLVRKNWRDELEQLIKALFDQSVELKKSTLLAAKQIVNYVLQNKNDDNNAWEIVLYFSKVNPNVVKAYFPELTELVKETVSTKDSVRLELIVKIVSNMLRSDKKYIDQKELDSLQAYLSSALSTDISSYVIILCSLIELLRFCDTEEDEIQKKFIGWYIYYKKIKQKLNKQKYAEDEFTFRNYFSYILLLSTWLNNWPEIIVKCEELKEIHLTLVQDICKFFYYTKDNINKQYAVRSLGKIHTSFRCTITNDEVFKLYSDIFKKGSDYLKYLVLNNINTHIKQMKKTADSPEHKKEKKLNLKTVDSELLAETFETANLYVLPVLKAYYRTSGSTTRAEVVKFLMINLKFGNLTAHQVVEHMIAMLTDSNYYIVKYISQELKYWHLMDPTLLINNLKGGINKSYDLQKLLASTPRQQLNGVEDFNKSDTHNMKCCTASPLWNAETLGYIGKNKIATATLAPLFRIPIKNSEPFLKLLVKSLEDTMKQMIKHAKEQWQNYGKFAYIVENISTFPYDTLSQLRTVINELDVIITIEAKNSIDQYYQLNDHDAPTKQVYLVYLRMAQVTILIHIKTFLWHKYVIPDDLIYNKRYDSTKKKVQTNQNFDQYEELYVLHCKIELLSEKYKDSNRFKSELPKLRAAIAIEDSNQNTDPLQNHSNEKCKIVYGNDTKQVEHLVNAHCEIETTNGSNSSDDADPHDKKEKLKQVEHFQNADGGMINKNTKISMYNSKENTHQNIPDGNRKNTEIPKNDLPNKIEEIAEKNKILVTAIIETNHATDQNINGEMKTKNKYKDLYKLKRPVHPRIVERAKQANIEWEIVNAIQKDIEYPTTRKSKVKFDRVKEMDENRNPADVTNVKTTEEIEKKMNKDQFQAKLTIRKKTETINEKKFESNTWYSLDRIIDSVVKNYKVHKDMKTSENQLNPKSSKLMSDSVDIYDDDFKEPKRKKRLLFNSNDSVDSADFNQKPKIIKRKIVRKSIKTK